MCLTTHKHLKIISRSLTALLRNVTIFVKTVNKNAHMRPELTDYEFLFLTSN